MGYTSDFCYASLGAETPARFSRCLEAILDDFGIVNPEEQLTRAKLLNVDGEAKNYGKRLEQNFVAIRQNDLDIATHREALNEVLEFVYRVRCNVFHGSKTKIAMQDTEQQSRLLIYAAVLIATNNLLFHAADKRIATWKTPQVNFRSKR